MKFTKTLLTVALVMLLAACGGKATTTTTVPPAKKLRVVATTSVLTDFTKVVSVGRVELTTIMKPGVDPHEYEPTAADLEAMKKADLIIKNGAGLEKWFDKALKSSGSKSTVVDASQGVQLREPTGTRHSVGGQKTAAGEFDPHIWQSPQNAKVMIGNISRALVAADAAHAADYETTMRAYSAQIDAMREDIEQSFEVLTSKKIVTNHDSIGYFIDEFKLQYVGAVIPSFDSQAELSSSQISDLVAKIKAENVKAVFSESNLPPKAAETIASEANVKIVQGEDAIYGDGLGAPGSDADTYLKMERHNADVIVQYLS